MRSWISACLLAFALLLGLTCNHDSDPPLVKRVILISLDDVAAKHLSSYWCKRETTPLVDRLAKRGWRFERCVANANWTLPSHMSMLTGVRPRRHGVVDHSHGEGPSVALLTQVLKQARPSVYTAAVTSHTNVSRAFGFDRGFDEFHENPESTPPEKLLGTVREILAKHDSDDLFLFLHLFTAHWPFLPPADLKKKFDPDYTGAVQGVRADVQRLSIELHTPEERRDFEHLEALYDAEIAYLDREVGGFLEDLEKRGLMQDTLVIITADHGEAFREHGYVGHGVSFEKEELEVPLLLIGGPTAKSPAVKPGTAALIDLAPTILAALGVARGEAMEGDNLLVGTLDPDREIVSESSLGMQQLHFDRFAISSGSFKYISFPAVERHGKVFGEVLYDLAADPREEQDLSAKRGEALARFRARAQSLGYEPRDAFLVGFGPSAQPVSGRATLSCAVSACDMVRMATWSSDGAPALDWVDLKFTGADGAAMDWDALHGSETKEVLFRVGRFSLDGKTALGSGANGLFVLPADAAAKINLVLEGPLAGKLPAESALQQLPTIAFEDVRGLGQDQALLGRLTLLAFPPARSGKPPGLTPAQIRELQGTGYGSERGQAGKRPR
jgi:arylsulfatase